MKKNNETSGRVAGPFALGLLALLVAGCSGTPTRYYTLAETAPAPAAAASVAATPLAIELAPVAMPERFARPQLVVRQAAAQKDAQAEVEVLEQSRWSSSFENELRDALAAGIATRLSAFDATKVGRPRGLPVYRIAVQLNQFDAQPGSRVDGAFGWSVRLAEGDALLTCQLQLGEPVSGGMDGVALGAQRITARMADEIARNVAALAAGRPAQCPGRTPA